MSAPLENGDPRPTNEMVVAALRAGDMQALGVVYDRYGAALHTFAYSMVRSRERAADVTHDSLLIAVARIGQLRDPTRLRAWLYAIVRSKCLRALRGTKRETVFTDWHDTADDDLPDAELHRQEIRELVRSALDGLSPKDREVMELSLHHDLDNAEIAAVLGVSPSHVTALTSRSRKALERSLGTLLVARAGGEGCDELTQLLQPWDGNFTPLWRKRIAKHVDSCASCTGERRRRFTPAAILVALPMLAAPIVLRDRVMTDAEPVLAAYAQHAGEAQAATSVPGPVDASGADVVPDATSTTIIAGRPRLGLPDRRADRPAVVAMDNRGGRCSGGGGGDRGGGGGRDRRDGGADARRGRARRRDGAGTARDVGAKHRRPVVGSGRNGAAASRHGLGARRGAGAGHIATDRTGRAAGVVAARGRARSQW
ncbi:MAG: hypothetical protein CME34_14190 [Gordonia sp.]|uniref:RNA polymerase sigma factor n=1 Tax=Gordonia sp. (in: high G+C Gram-positive bacteria) TaxID=84139 RepID=UPI000C68220E|nr:sigma-70 family RNA polymerase sigma factor [Gordonia sp. (in: high G+C Gram-positive bacteria)]MAU82991.1 hypothetical protein [Gordonia sp. (in: high G+C Gram-positive bacteria)]